MLHERGDVCVSISSLGFRALWFFAGAKSSAITCVVEGGGEIPLFAQNPTSCVQVLSKART